MMSMESPREVELPFTPSRSPILKDDCGQQQIPQLSPRSASIPALMIEIGDGMMEIDDEDNDDDDPIIIREREVLRHREDSYGTSVYPSRTSCRPAGTSFDTETV
jgi:hypothetical protein